MLTFRQKDLYGKVTKTKFRVYMAPPTLDSHIAWQDNTKLIKFNQNFWLNLSHDMNMNRLGLQNT